MRSPFCRYRTETVPRSAANAFHGAVGRAGLSDAGRSGSGGRRQPVLSTHSAHCLSQRLGLQQNESVAVQARDRSANRGQVCLQKLQNRAATVYCLSSTVV